MNIYRVVLSKVMFIRAKDKEDALDKAYQDDFIICDKHVDSIIFVSKGKLSKKIIDLPQYNK